MEARMLGKALTSSAGQLLCTFSTTPHPLNPYSAAMVSSLVPPKVASPNAIGGSQDAARMQNVVAFYEKLPRGAAPEVKPKGFLQWYQARYMGRRPSPMPLVHLIGGMMLLGYAQNYYFHLRHHKNNAH